jgi:hypothetical protein
MNFPNFITSFFLSSVAACKPADICVILWAKSPKKLWGSENKGSGKAPLLRGRNKTDFKAVGGLSCLQRV